MKTAAPACYSSLSIEGAEVRAHPPNGLSFSSSFGLVVARRRRGPLTWLTESSRPEGDGSKRAEASSPNDLGPLSQPAVRR